MLESTSNATVVGSRKHSLVMNAKSHSSHTVREATSGLKAPSVARLRVDVSTIAALMNAQAIATHKTSDLHIARSRPMW